MRMETLEDVALKRHVAAFRIKRDFNCVGEDVHAFERVGAPRPKSHAALRGLGRQAALFARLCHTHLRKMPASPFGVVEPFA